MVKYFGFCETTEDRRASDERLRECFHDAVSIGVELLAFTDHFG